MPDDMSPPQKNRKRHGCLTLLLLFSGVLVTFVVLMSILGSINASLGGQLSETFSRSSHRLPPTRVGVYLLGANIALGLVYLMAIIAIWCWKKWGVFLLGGTTLALTVLCLTAGVPVATSLASLFGPVLIIFFAYRQWNAFR